MIVESLTTGMFGGNVWIIGNESTGNAAVIDPGDEMDIILDKLEKLNLKPVYILATHAHPDHIGAAAELQRRFSIPLAIHVEEKPILDSLPTIAQFLGLGNVKPPQVSMTITDGQILKIAGFTIRVIHTPGHTPGGVCYYVENYLFVGDTIFNGSVGRVDLPAGSWAQLEGSLRKIAEFPEDTILCPGHGPKTTLKEELRSNLYLKECLR